MILKLNFPFLFRYAIAKTLSIKKLINNTIQTQHITFKEHFSQTN